MDVNHVLDLLSNPFVISTILFVVGLVLPSPLAWLGSKVDKSNPAVAVAVQVVEYLDKNKSLLWKGFDNPDVILDDVFIDSLKIVLGDKPYDEKFAQEVKIETLRLIKFVLTTAK
jgi:hypothetical protein